MSPGTLVGGEDLVSELLARLGRPDDAKLVLITAEGLGSSNAANHGVLSALRDGVATTSGLQVPCPWSRSAASHHRGEDVGVTLTCLADHDQYRWGPITRAPSLLDGDGGFPRTAHDLGEHADRDELLKECRAQVERSVLWGFDPTHLSSHLDALGRRPELFDVYLELAVEFDLPISLPNRDVDLGFPARQLAADEGVLTPDHVVTAPAGAEARSVADHRIEHLETGVTEIRVRPAIDTPEIRAITPRWAARLADLHLVTTDWTFRSALARSGAELIGYAELRSAQRRR